MDFAMRSPRRKVRRCLIPSRRIEWELLRGRVLNERPGIHRTVHASDHLPLAFTLILGDK